MTTTNTLTRTTNTYDYNGYTLTASFQPPSVSAPAVDVSLPLPEGTVLYRTTSLDLAMKFVDAYRAGAHWAMEAAVKHRAAGAKSPSPFRLAWNQVASEEWQAGSDARYYSIMQDGDRFSVTLCNLERRIRTVGTAGTLAGAQTLAGDDFAKPRA